MSDGYNTTNNFFHNNKKRYYFNLNFNFGNCQYVMNFVFNLIFM